MVELLNKSGNRVPSSFRDDAGFVFRENGVLFRAISESGISGYSQLMDSGLASELQSRGWLVEHRECAADHAAALSSGAAKVLEPEPIPFLCWPWEWSFSQWKEAALLTLDLQSEAIGHGMRLKDASAFNVQFVRGRPVWIDTLSFEDNSDGSPWVAYRQFCRHFLAPLALMAHVDPRLGRMLLCHLDGVPLDIASKMLPWRTRVQSGLAAHLHLQARMEHRHEASDAPVERPGPVLSVAGQRAVLESLRSAVSGLHWRNSNTEWASYYGNTNYSGAAMALKESVVERMVEDVAPRRLVWDFGANDGRFSRIAASSGCQTVAWDIDPGAVDIAWRAVRGNTELPVLPLLLDLTNPSPSVGWDLCERESLVARGPADLVMALALVHHVCLTGQVPLERFCAFLARCAPAAIVEWIPRDDSQARRLLARRPDRCPGYGDIAFEDAVRSHWNIAEVVDLAPSGRRLYRLERRP